MRQKTETVFGLLSPRILKALSEFGFTQPTLPQKLAIPEILEDKNVLVVAPTGSGKTESAMLPILTKLESDTTEGIKALYITPLRALNRDMLERMKRWSEITGIDIQVRHGDTPSSVRRKQSEKPPDVLITTPETLQILFVGKRLRKHLKSVRYVVIDEVHELASSKRGIQLSIALERLVEMSGEFVRIGLSATVGDLEEIAKFVGGVDRDVKIINATLESPMDMKVISPRVKKEDYELAKRISTSPEMAACLRKMAEIIESHKSVLIFVNTRAAAEVIGSRLKLMGLPIEVHHGSLSREVRVSVEEKFKKGELKGLVCTSSMELGIDIGSVDHVIQYNSPREVQRAIQRVGRSGHSLDRVSDGTMIAMGFDDILECCVIARMALTGTIESFKVRKNAKDVLANQLCAYVMEGEQDLYKFYNIVKRAYPYRDLSFEELSEVAVELEEAGLIRRMNGYVRKRRRATSYFYDNISMIPDEKKYEVRDIVSDSIIGTLDEAFVVNTGTPGTTFITKGEMWRIVEVDVEHHRILVEPVVVEGEVPNWVGEEIPVPFEVAQEVGILRRIIFNKTMRIDDIAEMYHTDRQTLSKVFGIIKKHKGEVPDEMTVVVEEHRDESSIVINACFGHKVNETLGRFIVALLSYRAGSSIGMEIDPYRIKLKVPWGLRAGDVISLLKESVPGHIEAVIDLSLKGTNLFRWKFVNVAKRFGIISKDVDWSKVNLRRLLDVYQGTFVYRETIDEILYERMDVERTKLVLDMIRRGEMKVVEGEASVIGKAGFSSARDLLINERGEASVLEAFKERLNREQVVLFCVACKNYKQKIEVSRVPEQPRCPVCGSMMLAALKPWEEEHVEFVKKHGLRGKEKKKVERIFRNANIVMSFGKRAVIALAARGVGPETAVRILNKLREKESDFYRDILEAEREYARTKRFWD